MNKVISLFSHQAKPQADRNLFEIKLSDRQLDTLDRCVEETGFTHASSQELFQIFMLLEHIYDCVHSEDFDHAS